MEDWQNYEDIEFKLILFSLFLKAIPRAAKFLADFSLLTTQRKILLFFKLIFKFFFILTIEKKKILTCNLNVIVTLKYAN